MFLFKMNHDWKGGVGGVGGGGSLKMLIFDYEEEERLGMVTQAMKKI